ncbi:MAG TPA: flagellar export protein FliJ [Pirellulales bacterium]|jgi:flagellar export protein FliJ|nr:flagellar export protein FliJ [Pirellulales bacterium]
MPSFRFRLTTLLRLREAWRDERRAHLADAQQAEQLIFQRIAEIERALVELQRRALDAARPGTVNVDQLAESARYEMILKVDRDSADQQRQAVAAEVQKRREALVAADREVRVLEKLRDTQRERHREGEARQEAQRLDEMAVMRHERGEAF